MQPWPDEETPEIVADSPEFQALARFARLTARKRELNEDLREVQAQLDALEQPLISYLQANQVPLIQIEGFTLSPKRIPWAYPLEGVERAAVCEALKQSGLGRLVYEAYSTAALTNYVSELEEHHHLLGNKAKLQELLPAPLAQVVRVSPGYKLQALDRRKLKPRKSHEQEEDRTQGENTNEE